LPHLTETKGVPVSLGVLKFIAKRSQYAVFLSPEKLQVFDDLLFVFMGEAMKRVAHFDLQSEGLRLS
jgi:hypothetical protein